jgi:fructose-1-phosphate kinase PfkB-like protein
MNKEIMDSSIIFLRKFHGLPADEVKGGCDELEWEFSEKGSEMHVDAAVSTLDHISASDFIPKTHHPTKYRRPVEVIGSQTHGVLCINYNLKTGDGRIDIDKLSFEDISFTLGGDPMMVMFLLNLLGHSTALSTLIGTGYGSLYADAINASGIPVLATKRPTSQPIQINIQVDSIRRGSVCLYGDQPLDAIVLSNKFTQFGEYVTNHKQIQYALSGGAPAGDKVANNRAYFDDEIGLCNELGIRTGGEPKDKLQGDGLAALLAAKDFKPNEGELHIIKKCVLEEQPYTKEIKKEAREAGGASYQKNPKLAVDLYNDILYEGFISDDSVWIATLGKSGAVMIGKDFRLRGTVKDMTKVAAKKGGSSQGCGNAAWAGYIHAFLKGYPQEKMLKCLGAAGMAANLYPGNLGPTPEDVRNYIKYSTVSPF